MSFANKEEILANMADKMASLEHGLKQIADAKKQLCRNTTEAKSRIQCNISRQLETLRNREVWLLNQLDVVSSAKEEVLQQQSARLNKTLGLLQSSVQFPDNSGDNNITRNLARLDLGELHPEETPYVSFKSDPNSLRDAIMNYGRIDHTSVPPLHSPFMAPGQQAPSLPKQFEDYDDAEHHILYKTVEEINRNKTDEPCVFVNIPKLSNRLEDWLLYPTTTSTAHNTDPKFSFPKLSNNLSDWLRAPSSVMTSKPMASTMNPETNPGLRPMGKLGIAADPSIQTWLHKIKQHAFEEEEDDYDFVDEMSETRTQSSVETLEEPAGCNAWLSETFPSSSEGNRFKFKLASLPLDKWLHKSSRATVPEEKPTLINMSRYLKNVKDELDKWLAAGRRMTEDDDETEPVNERLRPEVPSTLPLNAWLLNNQMSKADNPWLHGCKSSRLSAASSRSSSFSSLSSASFLSPNKWLLNGGTADVSNTVNISCPFMDRYKAEMESVCWLKFDTQNTGPKSKNPLERYEKEGFDIRQWLRPQTGAPVQISDTPTPLKAVIDFQKANTDNSAWLISQDKPAPQNLPLFEKAFDDSDKVWLKRPGSPFQEEDLTDENLC